jgi:putative oligomerization/nucleic acid binding protein
MLMYLGLAVLLFVLIILMRLMRSSEKGGGGPNWTFRINSVPTVLTTALDSLGAPTKIVFNGQEYSSPDEMPPEARSAYDFAMKGVLADANRDGIPDVFKSVGGGGGFKARIGSGMGESADPVTRLKQLQDMKNAGLITDVEYEAKRSEILDKI